MKTNAEAFHEADARAARQRFVKASDAWYARFVREARASRPHQPFADWCDANATDIDAAMDAADHEHAPTGETRGAVYEACECGATRKLDRARNAYDAWHACEACAPGLRAEPDREWGPRIDAERVTLQFGRPSAKRLDTGKRPIEESPLFGGARQGSLFT